MFCFEAVGAQKQDISFSGIIHSLLPWYCHAHTPHGLERLARFITCRFGKFRSADSPALPRIQMRFFLVFAFTRQSAGMDRGEAEVSGTLTSIGVRFMRRDCIMTVVSY